MSHHAQNPPNAYRIQSDQEAIEIAHQVAAYLRAGASERDQTRQVPPEVVDHFSNSGLWGITIPREYGGADGVGNWRFHCVLWRYGIPSWRKGSSGGTWCIPRMGRAS